MNQRMKMKIPTWPSLRVQCGRCRWFEGGVGGGCGGQQSVVVPTLRAQCSHSGWFQGSVGDRGGDQWSVVVLTLRKHRHAQ